MSTPEAWRIDPNDYVAPHATQLENVRREIANTIQMTAPRLQETTRILVPYGNLNIELEQRRMRGNPPTANRHSLQAKISEHVDETSDASLLVARVEAGSQSAPLTINGEEYRGSIADNIALGALCFAIGALRSHVPLNTPYRASQNAKTRALQESMIACMRDAALLETVANCYVRGVADQVQDDEPITAGVVGMLHDDYEQAINEGSHYGHFPTIVRRHSMAENVSIEVDSQRVGRALHNEELIMKSGVKILTAADYHALIGRVSADGSEVEIESMLSIDQHGVPLLLTFQHRPGGLEVTAGSPVRSEVAEFYRFLAPQLFT